MHKHPYLDRNTHFACKNHLCRSQHAVAICDSHKSSHKKIRSSSHSLICSNLSYNKLFFTYFSFYWAL
uniref:Uncharacterized protein n=1 Tax=Picea sitchensis TaxID=3332 RepID=B8LR94_PICSI|nr:unknown [Picea sitchensis]